MRRPGVNSIKNCSACAILSSKKSNFCGQRTQCSPRQMGQQIDSAEVECQFACTLESCTVHSCLLSFDHRSLQRIHVGSSVDKTEFHLSLPLTPPPSVPAIEGHILLKLWTLCRQTQRRTECTHGGDFSFPTLLFH